MGDQGKVSKMIKDLKEIVKCYDSEIYSMLVECNMDPDETVIRLLCQDPYQEVKSKRARKKDTKDQAESSRRRIPNHYNTARGGGNKFNTNETRLAQSVPANRRGNHWAGSSSAPGVRSPPNSDPKNAEVKKASKGSTGAASSSSLPAPAYQSAWSKANPGKKTMAEIVKMGKPRSSETQESGTKAPLKDEGSSTEKQDVYDPASSLLKPIAESNTHADRVSEPQHVDESRSSETQETGNKAPLKDEGSSVEKQDVSNPVSFLLKPAAECKTHANQVSEPQHVDEYQMEIKTNPVSSHPDVDLVAQCSHLRFGRYGFNHDLEDKRETGEDSSFRHLFNSLYEKEKEEEVLADNATDEQTSYQIDSTASNYHASSDSETQAAQHEEPSQEDLQMQNLERLITNAMDVRDESIPPHGAGQPLNEHPALDANYHQHGMPLGNHGDFTSDQSMPHGYMHSGFQQGFPVGNHQAPLAVVQNENSPIWHELQQPFLHAAPGGGVYIFSAHTSPSPHSMIQAQRLYLQQLSQQTAMSMDRFHHRHQHHHQHQHQHHHYHHQQRGGEASSRTREHQWRNNN